MNRIIEGRGLAAVLLALAACAPLRRGDGESYAVGGDPWAQPTAKVGGGVASQDGDGKAGAKSDPGAAPAGAPAALVSAGAVGGGGTVLEQLDAARHRVGELEQDNRRFAGEVASLTAVVDQLKRDNANLALMAQQSQESRTAVDGELDALGAKIKDLELRSRQLADDLLAERIKRVRIERQLILAKVTEAESSGDGP